MEASVRFCPSCGTESGATSRGGILERRTSHIKYRNMFMQVILAIITFGIYTIYWYYVTLEELSEANGELEGSGCMWTILYIIPFINLFANWHHSSEYSKFVDNKYPEIAIFILWIVFSPVVWFLVQSDLNRAARRMP